MRFRAVSLLLLLPSSGCGLVAPDHAWVSERAARELFSAAEEMEHRGDHVRAAEVYEGLALGFPEQHWAEDALARAAVAREQAAERAQGDLREEQMRRAAELWGQVQARYPDSPWAARARRAGALIWVHLDECDRAAPLLHELAADPAGLPSGTLAELYRRCRIPRPPTLARPEE